MADITADHNVRHLGNSGFVMKKPGLGGGAIRAGSVFPAANQRTTNPKWASQAEGGPRYRTLLASRRIWSAGLSSLRPTYTVCRKRLPAVQVK